MRASLGSLTSGMRASSSGIQALKLLAIGSLVAVCGCPPLRVQTPVPNALPDRWLLLDEPLNNSVRIGDTWNGSSVGTLCATGTSTLDATGATEFTSKKDSSNAIIGARIAAALHFDASLKGARAWTIDARGAKVAIGQDIEPRFVEACQPLRDGVPRYPIIDALLQYDSLIVTITDSNGRAATLDSPGIRKVIDTVHLSVSTAAGRSIVKRVGGAWIGMHLFAVQPAKIAHCTIRAVVQNTAVRCAQSDFIPATVSTKKLSTGDYQLTLQTSSIVRPRVDTVTPGFAHAFGLPKEAQGGIGDWFEIRVSEDTTAGTAKVEFTRFRYGVRRFLSERDRNALQKFLRDSP